jgi:hypothetical protein
MGNRVETPLASSLVIIIFQVSEECFSEPECGEECTTVQVDINLIKSLLIISLNIHHARKYFLLLNN